MGDVVGDGVSGVVEREGHARADAVAFEGLVPAFDFAVRLGVVGRGLDVGHAGNADELFEVLGDELGPVVRDDARTGVGILFAGALQDNFDVGFLHFFADVVADDEAAAAVEYRAEEVEGAGDVEVADVDVPVLVGLERLDEAGALLGRFGRRTGEKSGGFEDAVDGGGAAGGDIGVEHHEGESAIAFERVGAGKGVDAFLFVVAEPVVAGDEGVVLVDLAEAFLPVVEFAGGDAGPGKEATSGNVRLVAPVSGRSRRSGRGCRGVPSGLLSLPKTFF